MKKAIAAFIVGILLIISLLGWGGARIYKELMFEKHCQGYMKRAADANTVEIAKGEMCLVVKYLEENGMTSGHTSILYKTPDEDIGFFYKNMKASLEGLENTNPNASDLEKSNILIKLRETLLDSTGGTSSVTVPEGISISPNNIPYFLFAILATVLAIAGVIIILIGLSQLN